MLLNHQVPFNEAKVQLLDQVVNAMYGSNQQDVSTQPSKNFSSSISGIPLLPLPAKF